MPFLDDLVWKTVDSINPIWNSSFDWWLTDYGAINLSQSLAFVTLLK